MHWTKPRLRYIATADFTLCKTWVKAPLSMRIKATNKFPTFHEWNVYTFQSGWWMTAAVFVHSTESGGCKLFRPFSVGYICHLRGLLKYSFHRHGTSWTLFYTLDRFTSRVSNIVVECLALCFVFERSRVKISAHGPVILTEVFRVFF
jgi:hypothetical protein